MGDRRIICLGVYRQGNDVKKAPQGFEVLSYSLIRIDV